MYTLIPIFLFIFFAKFKNIISPVNELYIPYSDYKNPSINSIYGTGNRTLDLIYRSNCAKLCGQENYTDTHCCEGNTLEEEKCQSFKRCQEILDNFQYYVIGIALISYLSLTGITMFIVFIVYYFFTRDRKFKCKNAYSSALIVLFSALLIPILILQIYCCYKAISIEQFFGAKFDECFNLGKTLQSTDVINDRKPTQNEDENFDRISYREKGGYNQRQHSIKNTKIVNQKDSQRSGDLILKDSKQQEEENQN